MAKKKASSLKFINIPVLKGNVLGVDVYRGYAKLSDLSLISKADIYDQKTNPTGTQRDLSPKHAKSAYEYVSNRELAYWPEVFLSLRDQSVIKFTPTKTSKNIGKVRINIGDIRKSDSIAISRIDGNHRLHYAGGEYDGFPKLDNVVSFCLAHSLNLEQEITLFRDINDNQRRMNTSHLDNIEARLTTESRLKIQQPDLYIAQELGRDKQSPFLNKVYEGGKKPADAFLPLRSLRTGIKYMFSQPSKLTELPDVEAQYKVIRNYFSAVKKWEAGAWNEPRKYLVLRGAGFWGICFIGSNVIDRVLTDGKFSTEAMLTILKSGRDWDWSSGGDFSGLSGRGGAVKIRDYVVAEFEDSSGVNVKELTRRIIGG